LICHTRSPFLSEQGEDAHHVDSDAQPPWPFEDDAFGHVRNLLTRENYHEFSNISMPNAIGKSIEESPAKILRSSILGTTLV
jgi:hypothetical protein